MRRIINKKLLLIISMLAVTFALAGCSSRVEVAFDYDPDELAQLTQQTLTSYLEYAENDAVYNYVVNEGADAGYSEVVIESLKTLRTFEDTYGEFISFKSNYTYKESNGSVVMSVYADCTDKEVVFNATFSDNSDLYNYYRYAYLSQNDGTYTEDTVDDALISAGIYPYELTGFTVASNENLGDVLKEMDTTAVIGVVVAIVVILIVIIIIVALKKKPEANEPDESDTFAADNVKAAANKAESEKTKESSENGKGAKNDKIPVITSITNTATGQSAMDDGELVAVITAAVMAADGESPRVRVNYPSKDKLIVRPRKINRRYLR